MFETGSVGLAQTQLFFTHYLTKQMRHTLYKTGSRSSGSTVSQLVYLNDMFCKVLDVDKAMYK